MKILLINKFHYFRGGAETYYFALEEELVKRGHEVIFFSMSDEKNLPCTQSKYFVPNVEYEGKVSALTNIKNAFKLIYSNVSKKNIEALIKAEKPDIVHMNLVHRHLTMSIVDVLKKYNIPMVFTVHDYICICPCYTMLSDGKICSACMGGKFSSCIKKKCVKNSTLKSILGAMEGYFLKWHRSYDKIDLYISPSRFLQQKLINDKFTKKPIIHKYNFLPSSVVYERGTDNGYFLFSGRLSHEKGILTLIKAMKDCAAPLYIAGDGPIREEIKKYINDNNLSMKIKMLGYCSKSELARLIKEARCVVVPSEWYENCPYSVMEAMAKGKPIIGAEIGGIPELVTNNVTGILFEAFNQTALAQAISRMNLMPENEYELMCNAALEDAKTRFDAAKYAEEMEKIYHEIIDSKNFTQHS